MQIKSLIASALISTSLVTADDSSSSTWTTLTPTATYKNGVTDYASTFGIAVEPITSSGSSASSSSTSTASAAQKKRDAVSQVSDGQIQATTSTAKAVSTKSSSSSTTKATTTAAAVSQITDGQIQATTSTSSTSSAKTTDAASQISDGQIQATTGSSSSSSSDSTAAAASQVSDGQIQASTTSSDSSDRNTTTLSSTSASSTSTSADADINVVSCKTNGTLEMTITDGILRDGKGRIGSIVANRQFQFDGPPPQAGAIYAAGWAITPDGNLAIGDNDVFYQCLSGSFYNLYDESIGGQCSPVHLEIVKLVDC